MAVYNLSPFRRAAPGQSAVTFADPKATGEWTEIGGSLGELGDALAVSDTARVDPVRATPDPWAQLRTFADALLYPNPLVAGVVGQWRGLLALLAFAEHRRADYRLHFSPVDLAGGTSKFAQVMAALLPKQSLPGSGAARWDRPVVVRIETGGRAMPLAVLNPACLIAAGRDAAAIRIAAVPWMKDGLRDPTALTGADALALHELKMLHVFVTTLEADLTAACAADLDDDIFKRLRGQLQAYAKACLDAHPGVAAVDGVVSADAYGEHLPPLYRLLRRTVTIAFAAESSDCRIALRGDLGAVPFKGLVLLDAGLAATLGLDAQRIHVWEDTTLRDALASPARVEALRARVDAAGYLLVEPGDFFTGVLARLDVKDRDGHIVTHGAGFADALLPLSPLALLVAAPAALSAGVGTDPDGYVTFALRLASGRAHVVRRKFTARPVAGQGRLLDRVEWGFGDLALWPDFRSAAWHRYFARVTFDSARPERLRGRIATSGRALAAMRTGGRAAADHPLTAARRASEFRPWLSAAPFATGADPLPPLAGRINRAPWLTRLRGRDFDHIAVELQSSEDPFEAVFFTIVPAANEMPVPAGLVVVRLNETASPAINTGVVAVDFGTTNTVACIDTVEPVVFARRVVHPIASKSANFIAAAEDSIEKVFQDFFPPEARRLPTPSVVVDRDLDDDGRRALADAGGDADDAPMFRDLIYFQPAPAARNAVGNLNLGQWNKLLGRTMFNLKWTTDARVKAAAKRYLRQFVLMLAAEAADRGLDPARLKWRFSRPDTMLGSGDFEEALKRLVPQAIPGATPANVEPLRSEGLSAAAFILTSPANAGRAFVRQDFNVILDIGGGTTDFAMWDKGDGLWGETGRKPSLLRAGSVRLAGGDFFTAHILGNPDLLGGLGLAQWIRVIRPSGDEGVPIGGDKLRYVGELLFSGETLNSAFEARWHDINMSPDGERLKATAAVYLGGIAWYLGRVARELVDDGTIADAGILDRVAVALCGRGAGLFARIQGPDPDRSTLVSRLLALLSVAADHRAEPSVYVSPSPKIEVAAGMIDHPADGLDARSELRMFEEAAAPMLQAADAGPAFAPAPRPVRRADDLGMTEIDAFLAAFPAHAGFAVTLTAKQRNDLPTIAGDATKRDIEAGYPPNPPFIAALKGLVAMMIQDGNLRPAVTPVPR